jgi:phospholipid/cholesterol/gamma-HCH transport system substrate-binding protein
MPHEREIKVGLLVLAAIAVLAGGLLLLGTEEKLFVRKSRYFIRFDNVDGLAPGGVVELNGVNVGKVAKVVLPENPGRPDVDVWVEIERHYAKRLRAPARTAAGPPSQPAPGAGMVPPTPVPGAGAPAAQTPGSGATPAAQTPGAGAALPSPSAAAASSPAAPVPAPPAPAPAATKAEIKTQGLLGDKYVAITAGSDEYPMIPENGEIPAAAPVSVEALLASGGDLMGDVKQIVRDLKGFTGNLNQGGGLVPRLVTDREYGRQVATKLRSAIDNLDQVTGKIASGQGTLGKLVADPSVYNGLNDVIVGVNQNKMLRWLVQNRQKAGMAKRNQDATQKPGGGGKADHTQQHP